MSDFPGYILALIAPFGREMSDFWETSRPNPAGFCPIFGRDGSGFSGVLSLPVPSIPPHTFFPPRYPPRVLLDPFFEVYESI